MDIFKYDPLPTNEFIRVLDICPGDKHDPIECNLWTEVREETQGTYAALSYCWGDASSSEDIRCNGKVLTITSSLADALRAVRNGNGGSSKRIWADAIAINQHDTAEKNHQVKGMGSIYEHAAMIHIWLGTDRMKIAERTFKTIESVVESLHSFENPNKVVGLTSGRPPVEQWHWMMNTLMDLPWFSRVWVVQEAALGTSCQLHWGTATMDFANLIELACFYDDTSNMVELIGGDSKNLRFLHTLFLTVYRHYGKTGEWGRPPNPYVGKAHHVWRVRRLTWNKPLNKAIFLDALSVAKSLNAHEPLDHVYPLLGHPLALKSDGQLIVDPDYNKSEQVVYLELAEALLSRPNEYPYVLCFVQHEFEEDVLGRAGPTWVPRWRRAASIQDRDLTFTIGNVGLGQIAGGPSREHEYTILESKTLHVKGVMIGTILWTSDVLDARNFALNPARWDIEIRESGSSYIESIWKTVEQAWIATFRHKPDNSRYHDDFSYVLVTGYNQERWVGRKEHYKNFESYLSVMRDRLWLLSSDSLPQISNTRDKRSTSFEKHTRNCTGRRVGFLADGSFTLLPSFAKPGDTCIIIRGMATPFVLRKAESQAQPGNVAHHLVGESYIHGCMRGEHAGKFDTEQIDLWLV